MKLSIKYNNKAFEVEVEEIGGTVTSQVKRSAPVQRTATPTAAPAPVATPAAPASSGEGTNVTASMPGFIVSITKKVGDTVKEGEEILVLEAMKMENSIYSPATGVVKEIVVKAGDVVQGGQVLAVIG